MITTEIINLQHPNSDLDRLLGNESFDKIFFLCDENTEKFCFPLLRDSCNRSNGHLHVIRAGEKYKNLGTAQSIWTFLCQYGATRKSLLINVGGGVVCDIGGFCAATFKRGIQYVNIPTTLLSCVDAAYGGKTGIDFSFFKNEIGAFHPAKYLLLYPQFLKTLPEVEMLSGFAEMVKHGILSSENDLNDIVSFDLKNPDFSQLEILIRRSIEIKREITQQDPKEQGLRKILNLGHTIGHALETVCLKKQQEMPHGYFVAWGIVAELYLSHKLLDFPIEKLKSIGSFIIKTWGSINFSCSDYDLLYHVMLHDKKNQGDEIRFVLMEDVGKPRFDVPIDQKKIFDSLDFLRDACGV